MTERPLWLSEYDEALASLIKRFAENIPDYIEFLGDLYLCMKCFVLEAGTRNEIDGSMVDFDSYLLSHQRCLLEKNFPATYPYRQFEIEGIVFNEIYSLRDNGLPVIESLETLKPGLFKAKFLQDIVDCVRRVEAAYDFDDLGYLRQSQVEFSLALDRYFFAIERLSSKYIALYGWQNDKENSRANSDAASPLEAQTNAERRSRRNAVRDATFYKWDSQGMTDAAKRDRWNAEHPEDSISLENANSGRETVRNAVRRERKRKTRGTS